MRLQRHCQAVAVDPMRLQDGHGRRADGATAGDRREDPQPVQKKSGPARGRRAKLRRAFSSDLPPLLPQQHFGGGESESPSANQPAGGELGPERAVARARCARERGQRQQLGHGGGEVRLLVERGAGGGQDREAGLLAAGPAAGGRPGGGGVGWQGGARSPLRQQLQLAAGCCRGGR